MIVHELWIFEFLIFITIENEMILQKFLTSLRFEICLNYSTYQGIIIME